MTDTVDAASASDFRQLVSAELDRLSAARRDALAGDPQAMALADGADRLLAGGKRLRPAFAFEAWRACGEGVAPLHAIVQLGAALELFQAAALVHDDLIDDSPVRRGLPAAHRFFAQLAGGAGASSDADADALGRASAILLGDLLLVESRTEADEAVACLPAGACAAARAEFAEMCRQVTVGQFLDVTAESRPWGEIDTDLAAARRVIATKSASYSVLGPVRLGAILAAADDRQVAALTQFGHAAGEAFQLRDDLLGVFGAPLTTGKPAGDDLREGKRTVLVCLALERLAPADGERLRAALGRRDLADADIDQLRALLADSGAPERCEELIASLFAEARTALTDAFTPTQRAGLLALLDAAVNRSA